MSEDKAQHDHDLLLLVSQGDQRAFRELVHRYSERVYFHALSFVKTPQLAEETTQDIFVQLWNQRRKLAEVRDFDDYLFVVSKHFLLSFLRRKTPVFEDAEAYPPAMFAQSGNTEMDKKELALLLDRAIAQLSWQKEQVFRLIHEEGHTQEEVGRILGIATRTVRWNLVSAINAIRDYLHRHGSGYLYLILIFSKFFY